MAFFVFFVGSGVSYRVFMAVMWLSQLTLLFLVRFCGEKLMSVFPSTSDSMWSRKLRWTVVFNMYTLRMVAFNMDMYEAFRDGPAQRERAVRKHDTNCLECAQMREANRGENSPTTRCYRFRTESSCHPREYNLLGYIGITCCIFHCMWLAPCRPSTPLRRTATALLSPCREGRWSFTRCAFSPYI
ncbi:putative glycerol uptake protein [Trypanosoma cruzi]|uniref:Putative glycerol uptake protein n=1 Tax=Trypanosoma cruzi TaxID=5693 RepID=A0A2V2ULP6_TRYCR|nr:putative glycerol uptake protein [Trypanosoma cruzi]